METAAIITVGTAATIRTEMAADAPLAGKAGLSGRSPALLALLIGAALVALAVPRMRAYLEIAPWARVVNDRAVNVEGPHLTAAMSDYCGAAARLGGDAVLTQDCARLLLRLADGGAGPEETGKLLSGASDALRRSVAAAPDRALAWAWLGEVEQRRRSPLASIVEPLRMSHLTGPHEASAMLVRAAAVLKGWGEMPDDLREVAEQDLRGLWSAYLLRRDLVSLYLASGYQTRVLIRHLVLTTEEDRRRFDAMAVRAFRTRSGRSR